MKMLFFLHIPKTGGTYVARNDKVIFPIDDLNHSVFVHKAENTPGYPPSPGYLHKMRKDVSLMSTPDRICFASVRNPYSWLVSYWFHSGCNIPESEKPSHYDYRLARKGFKQFVATIADRDEGWPSKKFIHFALFSDRGDLMVNRLVHQETLDVELEQLATDYDVTYQKKDRAMVSKGKLNYKTYYDEEIYQLVTDTWGRELKLFGYDFDGRTGDGILASIITQEQKQNIKYNWVTDVLEVK